MPPSPLRVAFFRGTSRHESECYEQYQPCHHGNDPKGRRAEQYDSDGSGSEEPDLSSPVAEDEDKRGNTCCDNGCHVHALEATLRNGKPADAQHENWVEEDGQGKWADCFLHVIKPTRE